MTLESWIAEIGRSVRPLVNAGVMDIRQATDPALSRAVALFGFPGVLPLWGGRLQTIGLLADPLAAPQTWSAVILSSRQGLTLASDARTILPQLIVQCVLSNMPLSAERFAERWSAIEPHTTSLHQTLGGTAEELEEVVSIVCDPGARTTFKYRKGDEAAFQAAHSNLFRKIDCSEPFVRYADWIDACINGQYSVPEDPTRYGSWGRRVLCWANRLARRQQPSQKVPALWLHRVIADHAGIDSGVPIVASWSVGAGGAWGETAILEAAEQLKREPPSGDAVADGLLRALLAEDLSYSGFAHAEAAAALDERGEPERAWSALQSAAWWAARNTGMAPDAMLNGARFLAERRGWNDVLWVVERAMPAGDSAENEDAT